MDYSAYLSDDQKKDILNQRLTQFAAEAYQHGINKGVAQAAGNEAGVQAADEALAVLDAAIKYHEAELAKLG